MFDRFVTGSRPSWNRRAVLIVSLSLHAAVAVALVLASVFHVAELTPPLLAVVFYATPEPPPPPPPPPSARRKPSNRNPAMPQPRATPTEPPATAPSPPPADDDGGDDGLPGGDGAADGQPGGLPGGHGVAPCVGGGCVAAPPPRPRNVGPHLLDAQRIAGADPHLPAAIRQQRGSGDSRFMARLCVDERGAVSQVSILSGIPGADADIVQALRGWRYKPQPIPVCFVTELLFSVE